MLARISPSLICMDLCNLERDVKTLENAGLSMLHVDIVDGYFSPSMPMGLDVVRQLRSKTALPFDCHVMAVDNNYIMEQLLDIGVSTLCFQVETERHIAKKLSIIKNAGVKPGLALSPATPLSSLEYALELCDFVLLMMINPGYAGYGGEARYDFMVRKISDLRQMIEQRGLNIDIELDGRVATRDLPMLRKAGADIFVAGTSCLFSSDAPLAENIELFKKQIADQS
ncbi:MAG: ribulose-phosphate 3-epimerase [Planctomycetes bacterium]|nr:ribulose-phosphate 3-epimerase [Planctomycetota bacterium]